VSDIVISEFMDEAAIAEVLAGRDVLYDATLVDRPDDLKAALADCRALLVRNRTQVRSPLLAAAQKLKVVGRLGVGLDNIDVPACEARGVAVRPATGANDLSVAEYVITAAMMLLRRAWFATDQVIAGAWPRMSLIGRELAGKRLGLVGYGAIARATGERARSLGMSIAGYDPFLPPDHPAWAGAQRLELPELLATSDVVSLHTPLTDRTRRMIDAAALAAMKRDAILINAARGGAGRIRDRAADSRSRAGLRRLPEPDTDAAHRRRH
jgi:(S)-sulfolactate dehydrogenase